MINQVVEGATKTDLAYAAGVLDGEGCIQFADHGRKQYRLSVTMATSDTILANWFAKTFGGPVYIIPRYNDSTRHPMHRWHLWDLQAGKFLRMVMPYLKLKKPQAKIGLKYCHIKQKYCVRERDRSITWKHTPISFKRQYARWATEIKVLKSANKLPRAK